ncbi:hypothetical protein [Nocardioides sambongensis]|uniref:hypothetical protein n=1 Tax=Nocardioides sambongensis TaxID=2589074 RepID=UPI0011263B5E|nr:hypothetical protein [Nocardioides sambongensis]
MGLKDRLAPALEAGDVVAGWEVLHDLHGHERREAKAAYEPPEPWADFMDDSTFGYDQPAPGQPHDNDAYEAALKRRYRAHLILALAAVELCGPVTAAQRVQAEWWGLADDHSELIYALWEKDRAWAQAFVDEASKSGGSGEMIRSVVAHHGFACPSGEAFLEVWTVGAPITFHGCWPKAVPDADEWLHADPLLPDLAYHLLNSDHCGSWGWLPEVLCRGVELDVLDRSRLLEVVLTALTTQHRPSAQAVMAETLQVLRVRVEEVPGGFDYMMGVLATTKSSVLKLLLPLALEMVSGQDDLRDLTMLVAGREKVHKTRLLKALEDAGLEARVGGGGVVEALELLAADDDIRFVAAVVRSLERHGAAPPSQPVVDEPLGLWGLRPRPIAPDKPWPDWLDLTITWGDALAKGSNEHPVELQRATFNLLTAMAADQDWRAPLLTTLQMRVTDGQLNVARTADAFADVFLAGGLRDAYPVALAVADTGAGVGRKPARLHLLLRMLARYAAEIPPEAAIALPSNIAELALSNGRTSAQEEARRLGAALAHAEDAGAWLSDLRADRGSTGPRKARGLWTDPVLRPLPGGVRLADDRGNRARDLAHLRTVVADPSFVPAATHVQCFSEAWVTAQRAYFVPVPAPVDELLQLAVITAAASHGSDAVRREMRRPVTKAAGQDFPHEFNGGRRAVQEWANSDFTIDDYWRTALRSVPAWTVVRQFPHQDREQRHHVEVWGRSVRHQDFDIARDDHDVLRQVPRVAELLAADSPLGRPTGNPRVDAQPLIAVFAAPGELEAIARFRLLEGLLNVEHNDVVLAAPTWADFTLDFDDLLGRLVACEGRAVGPLDLIQALHRLRPVDPARLTELDGLDVRTTPELTSPDGDESWDAVELVRSWVSSGGLPPVNAVAVDGKWTSTATAPVPFTMCRVLERFSSIEEDHYVTAADLARVFPTWADRAVRKAFVQGSRQGTTTADFPAHATGSFGVPLHDLFLHDLTRATVGADRNADRLLGARCALGHQRFDAALFAEAGLQRHRAGTLDLPHLLETTQALGEQRLVKQLWPLLTALASSLASEAKRPPALAGMFRQLSGWVVEIPVRVELPDGIRNLAAARGSTKAHEAARTLVAAVEQA